MAIIGGTSAPLGHYNSLNYKVDIIAVPAILADPCSAWGVGKDSWIQSLDTEVAGARVLLYDHLLPEERELSIKPHGHAEHQASVEQYARAEDQLGQLGIRDWADRLTKCLRKHRNSPALRRRPVVFLCHSTGGIVVKQALSARLSEKDADIAACCLWIAFFSTPHKGSSVLSDPVFARTLKDHMNLKWQMSDRLRTQLELSNPELEHLSDRFCSGPTLGIQISTYVETHQTELEILTEADGESLTSVLINVVDPQSAELSTANAPMEEDMFEMPATHVTIAALANDPTIKKALIDEINGVVRSTNSLERAAHHDLLAQITNDTPVDVHQFYQVEHKQESATTKIWTEKTTLQNFLEIGPSEILRRRFDHHHSAEPSIEIQRAPDTPLPVITDGHVRPNASLLDPSSAKRDRSTLSVPEITVGSRPEPYGLRTSHVDKHDPIRKSVAFPAPSKQRDRFRWIHFPYTVTGWVGPVMKAICKDENVPELSSKILTDSLWKSQHNKSRHASHHSRFVRSLCRVLRPKVSGQQDDPLAPMSAVGELQFAMFFPYLHWDSFGSLKARNAIIKKRNNQEHIRPVDDSVLKGNSLEHKVIWQFLGSNMPVHCRRTLDGYGYPSLANTDARDMDQVMFKRTSRPANVAPAKKPGHHFSSRLMSMRSSRSRPGPMRKLNEDAAYVLMVDELWLWILQDDCMVTFATPKEKEEHLAMDVSQQADLKSQVVKDVSGDFARQVEDCFDHAALLAFHAVRALLEESEDPALNVFRTFEEHITEIAEIHTTSFKQFRDSHKIDDPKLLFQGSHNLDYSSDLDNLLELRDVEDELNTIKRLFSEQKRLVIEMTKQYEEEVNPRGKGLHGTALLREAENLLLSYEEQLDGMIKSAKVAQDAFENLLDLKQKHSNIVEAHMTRYQTEMASEQSRSVMIFTVVTIIFLPLSFFSSVFGMNVSDWSGQDTNLPLNYVLTLMGTISLAVIVVALAAAFNEFLRRQLRQVWRYFGSRAILPVWRLLARSPVARLRRIASKREHVADPEKGLLRSRPYSQTASRGGPASGGPINEAHTATLAPWHQPVVDSETDEPWAKSQF